MKEIFLFIWRWYGDNRAKESKTECWAMKKKKKTIFSSLLLVMHIEKRREERDSQYFSAAFTPILKDFCFDDNELARYVRTIQFQLNWKPTKKKLYNASNKLILAKPKCRWKCHQTKRYQIPDNFSNVSHISLKRSPFDSVLMFLWYSFSFCCSSFHSVPFHFCSAYSFDSPGPNILILNLIELKYALWQMTIK